MEMHKKLIEELQRGDKKSLARCITIVENELGGYENILSNLKINGSIPVVGVEANIRTSKIESKSQR